MLLGFLMLFACADRPPLPPEVGAPCASDEDCPAELVCVTEEMISWQTDYVGQCHPRCTTNEECRYEAKRDGIARCEWCTVTAASEREGFCMFEGCK